MRPSRRRSLAASGPAGRLLLGTLQALVGAGVVRRADAPRATSPPVPVPDAHGERTHASSTYEEFMEGAARVTRLAARGLSQVVLDYERGVLPDVDEFLELVGDTPDGVAPELDYQMTWATLMPNPGSGRPPLVRLDLTLSSLPTRLRVVIEPEHQAVLWHLTAGAALAIAFAEGADSALNLGPLPDPSSLAQLLTELAVSRAPALALAPRRPLRIRRPRSHG
jgi:hypothetical protein